MEITLEKIELVKDRTGVSYREAKEALEATEGNVVDAIIKIEDEINAKVGAKISDNGAKVIEKIKEYIKKGNVSRVTVKKDDEIVINIPVTVGVVGTALAPWLTVIGSIVALGLKCDILLVKEDGAVIDLTLKVNETIGEIKEKSNEAVDSVRSKVADTADAMKDKKDKVMSDVDEIKDIVADAAKEIKETIKADAAKDEKDAVEADPEKDEKDAEDTEDTKDTDQND